MFLDDQVTAAYANPVQVLANRGIGIIRQTTEGSLGVEFSNGVKMVKAAKTEEPGVNLSHLTQVVYAAFNTFSSMEKQDGERFRRVYATARELECPIDS